MIPKNEFTDFKTVTTNRSVAYHMPSGRVMEYEWPPCGESVPAPTSWLNYLGHRLVDQWGHEYIIRDYESLGDLLYLKSIEAETRAYVPASVVHDMFWWRDMYVYVPAPEL